jgi:predicted nucleic acid-binding protein
VATYYFDTSALLKLYIEERGTDQVISIAESLVAGNTDNIVILDVTLVESRSAVRRREREGDIPTREANQVIERIGEDRSSLYLVEPASSVTEEAARLIDSHPLRALDALQLAGCLTIRRNTPPPLTFVCADERLCHAANIEGLATINPLDGPEHPYPFAGDLPSRQPP